MYRKYWFNCIGLQKKIFNWWHTPMLLKGHYYSTVNGFILTLTLLEWGSCSVDDYCRSSRHQLPSPQPKRGRRSSFPFGTKTEQKIRHMIQVSTVWDQIRWIQIRICTVFWRILIRILTRAFQWIQIGNRIWKSKTDDKIFQILKKENIKIICTKIAMYFFPGLRLGF